MSNFKDRHNEFNPFNNTIYLDEEQEQNDDSLLFLIEDHTGESATKVRHYREPTRQIEVPSQILSDGCISVEIETETEV